MLVHVHPGLQLTFFYLLEVSVDRIMWLELNCGFVWVAKGTLRCGGILVQLVIATCVRVAEHILL